MENHPVTMTRIYDLPVSVYEDGSVEIVDEHSPCRLPYRAGSSKRSSQ